jgi:hypothetical protein
LYDGKWINENPDDVPITLEVLSNTGIRIEYEGLGSNICDMFYSPGELTSIGVSLGGIELGKYSVDPETGILTHKPDDTTVLTYKKEG